jgi:hypothetical protein
MAVISTLKQVVTCAGFAYITSQGNRHRTNVTMVQRGGAFWIRVLTFARLCSHFCRRHAGSRIAAVANNSQVSKSSARRQVVKIAAELPQGMRAGA